MFRDATTAFCKEHCKRKEEELRARDKSLEPWYISPFVDSQKESWKPELSHILLGTVIWQTYFHTLKRRR